MEKLKLHTPDLVATNIDRIAALFPSCITESRDATGRVSRAVDFDQLRQELSNTLVEGPQERYRLDWPGKREALLTANAPIAKTLRPRREESVDFDTTKNLFIEGDNLDALKLIQEAYLNQVTTIFIDPPYNTGKDFLYNDNFKQDTESYLRDSNQKDELGNRMVWNTEANGRFHSDWLTMIYARLRLAWNLLSDDGLIAVAIDDSEVFQLGKVMDEVFGSGNRLACAPWLSEASGGKEKTGLRSGHEYILIYVKRNAESISQQERSTGELNLKDKAGAYRKGRELMKWGGTSLRSDRPNQHYALPTPNGDKVFPYRNDGKEGHWRWGKDNVAIQQAQLDPSFFHWESRPFDPGVIVDGAVQRWVPYEKIRDVKKSVGWSTWLDRFGANADATRELKELFGTKPFDTPKPTSLIKWILSLHSNDAGLVLDFFAGSCSTAQAVLELNSEDFGSRRFIMVQLDEPCAPDSGPYKMGYKTIADIGKDRLKRFGAALDADKRTNQKGAEGQNVLLDIHPATNASPASIDKGFRVLKIDASNMKDVYYRPDALKQADLLAQANNIREDRTPADLLFQVLVDWGIDLTLPITTESISGKSVFFVDGNALAACFENDVTEELVTALAKRRENGLPLLKAVFRDASYRTDSVKINVEQVFKLLSPTTDIRTL